MIYLKVPDKSFVKSVSNLIISANTLLLPLCNYPHLRACDRIIKFGLNTQLNHPFMNKVVQMSWIIQRDIVIEYRKKQAG